MTNLAFGLSRTPYSWRSCTNPWECPDEPCWDDVKDMEQYWMSDCCNDSVRVLKNGAKWCECCGRFCVVDPFKTIAQYDHIEGAY